MEIYPTINLFFYFTWEVISCISALRIFLTQRICAEIGLIQASIGYFSFVISIELALTQLNICRPSREYYLVGSVPYGRVRSLELLID